MATWAEEFLRLSRRLAPASQQTYRRDLHRHVPRFGDYRLGRIPADEIENWLNDEIGAGVDAVVGPPPLPHAAPADSGGRREAEDHGQPVRSCASAEGADAGDDVPVLRAGRRVGRGPQASATGP